MDVGHEQVIGITATVAAVAAGTRWVGVLALDASWCSAL